MPLELEKHQRACSRTPTNSSAGRQATPERKIGGLVLEVKGDFCQQVHGMLTRAGRASDYTEIRLGGDVCYNPLHNDLDPYAVAYAVSTLVNNLFGKSKEPFWQQAYTDLLKFVILLRRLADGYTTLAEVYRYVLEDGKIEAEITKLKAAVSQPPEWSSCRSRTTSCKIWRPRLEGLVPGGSRTHGAAVQRRPRITSTGTRDPYEVRRTKGTAWLDRKHQIEAVDRWFTYGWKRLDNRLRSSITEGIVVFLSLFDENPAVHRTFCPPRSVYASAPKPGEPKPLPPLEELLESGVCWRSTSGRSEPRACARRGRDVEAGLPARSHPAHPKDCGAP